MKDRSRSTSRSLIEGGLVLLLLFLTPTPPVAAQNRQPTNLREIELVGPVKTLRIEWEYSHPTEGKQRKVQVASFNELGNLTGASEETFGEEGSLRHKASWEYSYDTLGSLKDVTFKDGSGGPTTKQSVVYDDKGRKWKNIYCQPDGAVIYEQEFTYDERGNITGEYFRKPDGTAHSPTLRYEYDEKRRMTGAVRIKPDGELALRSTGVYDDGGRLGEWFSYDKDGILITRSVYRYDSKGRQVESLRFGKDGSLISKEAFTYEYDSRGNWVWRSTAREMYKGDRIESVVEVVRRTISYY